MGVEQPKLPARIGYEASGIIDAVGAGVEGINVGDKVSTIPSPFAKMSQYGVYGEPDEQPPLPSLLLLMNAVTIRFVLVYIMPEEYKQSAIQDITKALEAGALHHNIARRFPLSEIAIAHDVQDSGQAIGKVILEIA